MRRSAIAALFVTLFLCCVPPLLGQQRQSPRGRQTWYEFVVQQFNKANFDYGNWIEQRRQAFLEATVKTPYFWYSFSVTGSLLLLLVAYTKLHLDHRKTIRIADEIQADLHNHDLYSRQAAREAIEKYNRHIEQCNRAIENAESGQDRPGWGDSPLEGLRAELRRVAAQLDATTQDRNKLQKELQQKSLVVTDLSSRLDALSRKLNGSSSSEFLARDTANTEASGNGAKFVGHINRLQEELYTERQKNKRLKGA
jgi:hypothetical protein